jgi:hypothetical protein
MAEAGGGQRNFLRRWLRSASARKIGFWRGARARKIGFWRRAGVTRSPSKH